MAELKPVLPLIPALPPHKGTPRERLEREPDADTPTEQQHDQEKEGSAGSGPAGNKHILDEYA
jgi:hypothetical protein